MIKVTVDNFKEYEWIRRVIGAGVLNISPNEREYMISREISLEQTVTFIHSDYYNEESRSMLIDSLKTFNICDEKILNTLSTERLYTIYNMYLNDNNVPTEYLKPDEEDKDGE